MKALKWIAVGTGVVLGLVLAAVVTASLLLDPNDYRGEIAGKVEQSTGRELKIEGDIRLSFFPWLGLELGKLELGNAKGFGAEPFARIGAAEARVKLLPLFSGKVEIDKVVLRGLELQLARRADGSSNWDDLAGKGEAKPAEQKSAAGGKPAPAPGQKLGALAIGGIEISNARVVWQDDMAKQRVVLSDFNLNSGAISLEKPFPLAINGKVESSNPATKATIDLKTVIALDLNQERYRLDDLSLALDASGKVIPGGKVALTLDGDVAADLKQQTASIKGLLLKGMGVTLDGNVSASRILAQPAAEGQVKLVLADPQALNGVVSLPPELNREALKGGAVNADFRIDLGKAQTLKLLPLKLNAMGLELTARVDGKQIIDNPSFSGDLASGEFVPRLLLKNVGVALPDMADPSVMGKAKLSTDFDAGLNHAALSKLKLQLDNTSLSGSASVKNFKAPVIRYQLAVDGIDADRYLPPPSDKPAPKATPATATAAAATTLPLPLLRSLDIDGTFKVGKVKVMNLSTTDIVATVRATKGKFRVHPLGAKLYQGSYAGDLGFDVTGKTPRLSMNEKLTGVQAGPLLKDFMGKDYVTGKANMVAKMSASGIDPMVIRKSLTGNGSFNFEKGQVKGINIGHQIRVAYAKVKKLPEPKEESKDTDFADLKGSFTAKNGVVNTKDLYARSPLFQVKGKGSADLVKEKLDMRLETIVVGNLQDAANQSIGELKGTMIPITIKGKFSDPSIGVDVESVLRERAQKEVKKAVDKEKKKLEEDLKKKLEDALKIKF